MNSLQRLDDLLDKAGEAGVYLSKVGSILQGTEAAHAASSAELQRRREADARLRYTVDKKAQDILYYAINGAVVFVAADYLDENHAPLYLRLYKPILITAYVWVVYMILNRR